jgi:hypothetical protein
LTAQKYFLRGEWIKNAPEKPVFRGFWVQTHIFHRKTTILRQEWIKNAPEKPVFQGFMGANTHISPQNDSFAAFKVFGIQPFFQKGLAGQGQSPWKKAFGWSRAEPLGN